MAELGPQAQAVLEAYWRAVLDPMSSQTRPGGALVAAALRAAAQFNPGPFVPELFDEGWKAAMSELEYIAAELEGTDAAH